jgi:hypothetical protein
MRRPFRSILRIGIGSDGVAVAALRRWPRTDFETLAERALAPVQADGKGAWPEAALAALGGLLEAGAWAGWPVEVVVADAHARLWTVEPPAQAQRLEDLQAACELRYRSLYGASPADWVLRADHELRQPYLAAALPRELVEPLHVLCREHRLALHALAPQFVFGWNGLRSRLARGGWLVQVHASHLVLGVGEGGGLHAVRTWVKPAQAPADWLADQLKLEAMRLDRPLPDQILVAGTAQQPWITTSEQVGQEGGGAATLVTLPHQAGLSAAMQLASTGWMA